MNFSRALNSKLTLLITSGIIIYLGFVLLENISSQRKVDERLETLKEEVAALEAKSSDIEKMKDYFESQDFLEKEARRMLNYQKPGEEVYSVIGGQEPEMIDTALIEEDIEIKEAFPKNKPFLVKWWEYFFY